MVSADVGSWTILRVTWRSELLLLKEKKRWQIIFAKNKTYENIKFI